MQPARHPRRADRSNTVIRSALLLLSGFVVAGTGPAVADAQTAQTTHDRITTYIAEASQRFGVPVAWIRSVLRVESGGDPRAVSPKGAIGLMQIMPATWAALQIRHGFGPDPYDPHDNILAGAAYLREMFDRYGAPGFLAAYNAGPGRYEAALSGRRPLPAETRAYVAALASIASGDGAPRIVVASIDSRAWTRAPLFIAQPDRAPAVDPAQFDGQASVSRSEPSLRDVSAIVPQSDGLFVARSGAGGAR